MYIQWLPAAPLNKHGHSSAPLLSTGASLNGSSRGKQRLLSYPLYLGWICGRQNVVKMALCSFGPPAFRSSARVCSNLLETSSGLQVNEPRLTCWLMKLVAQSPHSCPIGQTANNRKRVSLHRQKAVPVRPHCPREPQLK